MTPVKIERLRDLGNGRRDAIMMSPSVIQIEEGHNPRDYRLKENRDHLDELKANIAIRGVLQPLLVRFDASTKAAVLVDGECRLRAVLELIEDGTPIESVPVLQVAGGNETERLILAITANTGKPLSKWEIGIAFKRLAGFGWETGRIAKELGFSERFVKEAIELTDAPEEIKHLLSEGACTPSLVQYHMRKSGSGAVLSIRSAVDKARSNGKRTAKRDKKPPALLGLVRDLVSDITEEQIRNREFPFVEVNRKKLLKIWEAV